MSSSPGPTPSADQPTFDTRLLRGHSLNTSTNSAGSSRPSRYHSHPGCVLCGVVSSTSAASRPSSPSPQASPTTSSAFLPSPYPQPFTTSGTLTPLPLLSPSDHGARSMHRDVIAVVDGREVIYQDEEITVYRASPTERLCGGGTHLIAVVNRHVESVYDFGPADVPVLSHLIDTTERLLRALPADTANEAERGKGKATSSDFRVGFVGSITRDPRSPHAHLHAHALLGPVDRSLPGASFWRRNVVFGGMNWWSVEDLVAEIRESTSNNRIKSGYVDRPRAPITRVPEAGSVEGLPNALESEYKDASPRRPPRDAPAQPPAEAGPSHNISRQDSEESGEGYVAVELDDAR